jgi:hypothetical protein
MLRVNDFTYRKYNELLDTFLKNGYNTFTVRDWINDLPRSGIMLRHDVDRFPFNSLIVSKLENELGIKATYYFRYCKNSYNREIVEKISSMGHEIGYHYEDLSVAKGDLNKAIDLFEINLNRLRESADVKTISMHGRPMSKYDNRDIWKKYDFRKFGLTGEAYLSIDYNDIYYFSDTGRTWSNSGSNIRDKVSTNKITKVTDTDSLVKFITDIFPDKIAVLTHPERWNDNFLPWIRYYARDIISNNAKRIVKIARNK